MSRTFALLVFLVGFAARLAAQVSIPAMEARLNNPATPKSERLDLSFSLAEKLLRTQPVKSADYAHRAAMLASELGERERETAAYLLAGEAHYRRRDTREATARWNRAFVLAKDYGQTDRAIEALKQMQTVATQKSDFREAYRLSQEGVALLQKSGGGGSSTTSTGDGGRTARLERRLSEIQQENQQLRAELAKITGRTEFLESNYRETEAALREAEQKNEGVLEAKDQQIAKATETVVRQDSAIRQKEKLVLNLTKEQMADSILLVKRQKEVETARATAATAELEKKKSENFRNLLAMVAGLVLMLALVFYFRYLAKKRTANQLVAQNNLLETERQRSDNLLLNILPPAIANELKVKNKVQPQFYEQATVMFIDFVGFTRVSEQLSPEMLVEEIDYCFSNFDKIIEQFKIEKIKTIGDAYMCASGLSDKNASPSDMVRAALEIQDFLLHLRAERMSRNLPYFEARVGIHTGPVVAGVVGTKKFAYDIWGDTVNVAARIEESCEPGKVSVSETSYWLAKYEFDWVQRGKVAAKNKGMIDMYYVAAIR